MLIILRCALVCAAVFWTAGGNGARVLAGDTDVGKAADVVRDLQDSLIAIMKDGDALGYEGRYDALAPVVDQTHDLDTIARLVVGRHWKGLTEAQRSDFIRTFRELSIATYAGRFKDYGGERFTILSEKPLPRGKRNLVVGHFIKADGEQVTFHYILHRVRRRWNILGISVNGVSDLALKRAEYGGILNNDGLPTLLQRLQDQIQDHRQGH